jgi:Zn-finger nucleic acid-binding protein
MVRVRAARDAMMVTTDCPQCGQELQVPGWSGSRLVSCPECNHAWTLRGDELSAVAPGGQPAAVHGDAFSVVPILRATGPTAVDRPQEQAADALSATPFSPDSIKAGPARRWLNIGFATGQWLLGLVTFAAVLAAFFWYYQLSPVIGIIVFAVFGTIASLGTLMGKDEKYTPPGPEPEPSSSMKTIVFCPRCRHIGLVEQDVVNYLAGLVESMQQPEPPRTEQIHCRECGHHYEWTNATLAPRSVICLDCGSSVPLPAADAVVREVRAWGNVQLVCPHCDVVLRVKLVPAPP